MKLRYHVAAVGVIDGAARIWICLAGPGEWTPDTHVQVRREAVELILDLSNLSSIPVAEVEVSV